CFFYNWVQPKLVMFLGYKLYLSSLFVVVRLCMAVFAFEFPPMEVQYPLVPRGIALKPLELLRAFPDGHPSFSDYYLDDTGSTMNHPGISLSVVNVFGVKTLPAGNPSLILYYVNDPNRSLEFQLAGGHECRLKVVGMKDSGLWIGHSRVFDYSNDTFRWFTLERSLNYIAVYDPHNQTYPLLDFDNVGDEEIDFRQFCKFSVSSTAHESTWDFVGDHYKNDVADNTTILNPFVKSALMDVREQYIRYVREIYRCNYMSKYPTKYRMFKEREDSVYIGEHCMGEYRAWFSQMASRLRTVLLVNGVELPTKANTDNSYVVFGYKILTDEPLPYYSRN
ncbi:hypothetical protein OTU49_007684, partial [Cherax quadricarinatus]